MPLALHPLTLIPFSLAVPHSLPVLLTLLEHSREATAVLVLDPPLPLHQVVPEEALIEKVSLAGQLAVTLEHVLTEASLINLLLVG